MAAADAGYAIAERCFDAAQVRLVIADVHIGALMQSGQLAEAGAVANRLCKHAADFPRTAQMFGSAVAGIAARGAGRLDRASALLDPAVEVLSTSDGTGLVYRYRLSRTITHSMARFDR